MISLFYEFWIWILGFLVLYAGMVYSGRRTLPPETSTNLSRVRSTDRSRLTVERVVTVERGMNTEPIEYPSVGIEANLVERGMNTEPIEYPSVGIEANLVEQVPEITPFEDVEALAVSSRFPAILATRSSSWEDEEASTDHPELVSQVVSRGTIPTANGMLMEVAIMQYDHYEFLCRQPGTPRLPSSVFYPLARSTAGLVHALAAAALPGGQVTVTMHSSIPFMGRFQGSLGSAGCSGQFQVSPIAWNTAATPSGNHPHHP